MSGDGSPSPNGYYFAAGVYDGKPYYERQDSAYVLWYSLYDGYILSTALDSHDPGDWWNAEMTPPGVYNPYEAYTGNPIVAALIP